MNLFELMQIFSMSSGKIDSLWEFFVTVHLAIFGGLFIYKKLKTDQLCIALISYIAFSLINLRAKIQEYKLYESLLFEIKGMKFQQIQNLNNFFSNYDISDRFLITYAVHIFSFVAFLYLLYRSLDKINSDKL